MRYVILPAVLAALAFASSASAENGGDRAAAGGAFMSSYSRGPYASPVRAGDPTPAPGFGPGRDVQATGSIEPRAPRRSR